MREWLKRQYRLYKKPLWVLLADYLLSRKIGVQTQPGCEGSRCPLLPMTHRQHVFFTVSMLVMYGCLLWIMLIYLSDKHNRFK